MKTQIVKCAWCGKTISERELPDNEDSRTSHGICEQCTRENFGDDADEIISEIKDAKERIEKKEQAGGSPENKG